MAPRQPQRQSRFTLESIAVEFEKLLYRFVIAPLAAFLPASLAYGIACVRGDWLYRLDQTKRKQIISNLEAVLSDQLSPEERVRVTQEIFRRKSCNLLDDWRVAGKGNALKRLVEIRGLEHIEAALAAGKGAVICCAHVNSYSCFSLLGAYGFPVTAVGNWWPNPFIRLLERLFRRIISKPHHMRRPNIQPQKGQVEAAIRMAEVLRANEVLTIPIDVPVSQQDRAHAVLVDFLGHQIPLLPGSVSIAKHTGAQVLVLVSRRLPDWRHQVVEISPVPMDGDIAAVFRRCVAMVEAPIRQDPSLWTQWQESRVVDFGLL
jgi:KDO2-lipid IV(A) lauroyltransferase